MYTHFYEITDKNYQERPGLGYEHLRAGMKFSHRPGVTLSQEDNVSEALESCNAAMLHYDSEYAAKTTWGKPLMVSTLTVQKIIGLTSRTFGRRRRIVSMAQIAMTSPLFGGDTLYAETEVLEVLQEHDAWGLVKLRTLGTNQKNDVIAKLEYTVELWKTGCAPGEIQAQKAAMAPRFASHLLRDDGVWLEQIGVYFEDLNAGETFVHSPRRSVYAHEAIGHALRAHEWNGSHHDIMLAQEQGKLLPTVSQTWVLGMAVALSTRTFGRVCANLGWTDVLFDAEVNVGDTLEAASTILETRASASRPNEGVVKVKTKVVNQRHEHVVEFVRSLLVYRQGQASPYAAAGY